MKTINQSTKNLGGKEALKEAALELAAASLWLVIMFALTCATVTLADIVNNLLTK